MVRAEAPTFAGRALVAPALVAVAACSHPHPHPLGEASVLILKDCVCERIVCVRGMCVKIVCVRGMCV